MMIKVSGRIIWINLTIAQTNLLKKPGLKMSSSENQNNGICNKSTAVKMVSTRSAGISRSTGNTSCTSLKNSDNYGIKFRSAFIPDAGLCAGFNSVCSQISGNCTAPDSRFLVREGCFTKNQCCFYRVFSGSLPEDTGQRFITDKIRPVSTFQDTHPV